MIFYTTYLLWVFASAASLFKTHFNVKLLFVISPFFVAMAMYPYVSDLKFYYQSFVIDVYRADYGFIKLQQLLKLIFGTEIGFIVLIYLPIVILFMMSITNAHQAFVFLLTSQLLIMLPFNGVRQGYAIFLIWAALSFISRRNWIIGILLLMMSCLFHKSALFVAPIILLAYGFPFFKALTKYKVSLIILTAIAAVLLLETLFTNVGLFIGYFQQKDFSEGRTNPVVKYALFFLYFAISSFLLQRKLHIIPEITYIKFFIFSLALAIFLILGLSELAARIMVYYLGFEAYSLFALRKANVTIGAPMRFIWFFSNIFSPSVIGLLSLPSRI